MLMRHTTYSLSALLLAAVAITGCYDDTCSSVMTYEKWTPIYADMADLRTTSILPENSRDLVQPGKVYVHGDYLLINEVRQGIHIINNADPSSPTPVAFLPIRGNVDLAVHSGHLYADQVKDLLVFDFQNPAAPTLVHRAADALPGLGQPDSDGRVIVDYHREEVTEEVDCTRQEMMAAEPVIIMNGDDNLRVDFVSAQIGSDATSIGGSMSRFTVANGHLYTIGDSDMEVFDLSLVQQPTKVNTVSVGSDIETVFPYGDQLFVGSMSAMFIMDASTASAPTLRATFEHATACDPVFVAGNHAYVTLRTGNACGGWLNQLQIIDVSNLDQPQLMRTVNLSNPHGLSVRNKKLYIGEGVNGLTVFDIPDPIAPQFSEQISHHHAYDIISASDTHIIVIGDDGLYQYSTLNSTALQELSRITVSR